MLFGHYFHPKLLVDSRFQSSAEQLRLASKCGLQQHANYPSCDDDNDDNSKHELTWDVFKQHNFNDKRKFKHNIDFKHTVVDNFFPKLVRAGSCLLFHQLGAISSRQRAAEA